MAHLSGFSARGRHASTTTICRGFTSLFSGAGLSLHPCSITSIPCLVSAAFAPTRCKGIIKVLTIRLFSWSDRFLPSPRRRKIPWSGPETGIRPAETGLAGLGPAPSSPAKPRWFPGWTKPLSARAKCS